MRYANHSNKSLRPGFTLIEVMVVVGILIVLTALAIPAILIAKKKGAETRTRADLSLIESALGYYKQDFGDFPQLASAATDIADTRTVGGGNTWLDTASDRGAILLCRSLLGPGAAISNTANPAIAYPGDDGADGPGFRIRRTLVGTTALGGKVYGPYIQAEKFKLEYDHARQPLTNPPVMFDAKLLDQNGNPILYFPANPAPAQLSVNGGYVGYQVGGTLPPGTAPVPLYNEFDNSADTSPPLLSGGTSRPLMGTAPFAMLYLLGDRDGDGQIDNGEHPVTTAPYLLWTAGADGVFAFGDPNGAVPPAGSKTDDITNFDIPGDLRK